MIEEVRGQDRNWRCARVEDKSVRMERAAWGNRGPRPPDVWVGTGAGWGRGWVWGTAFWGWGGGRHREGRGEPEPLRRAPASLPPPPPPTDPARSLISISRTKIP